MPVFVLKRGAERKMVFTFRIKFQWRIVVASMRQPCGFKFVFTGAHQSTYSYKRMTKRTALLDIDTSSKREMEEGRDRARITQNLQPGREEIEFIECIYTCMYIY